MEDIISLDVGEVYAKLDQNIASFRCPRPLSNPDEEIAKRIIEKSRQFCYTPLSEINLKPKPKKREFDSL